MPQFGAGYCFGGGVLAFGSAGGGVVVSAGGVAVPESAGGVVLSVAGGNVESAGGGAVSAGAGFDASCFAQAEARSSAPTLRNKTLRFIVSPHCLSCVPGQW